MFLEKCPKNFFLAKYPSRTTYILVYQTNAMCVVSRGMEVVAERCTPHRIKERRDTQRPDAMFIRLNGEV